MSIVVDASVLIAIIGNEPDKAALVRLAEGTDLIAPQSISWEIGNALSAMLKRKRITVDQALQALVVYREIMIRFVPIELDEAVRIANELNIYAYDAYLIRCALKYNALLLSLDRELNSYAQRLGVEIVEVD
jgi:predicted nucleic acid-binding protein